MSGVLDLPFDQYQRYRLVSDLLDLVREDGEPLKVLDVGGRTALLRRFMTGDEIHLVDLEPSDEPGLVLGSGSRLPFRDKSFDVVAAFDTLEHVPPAEREAFVAECRRVARRYTVIAGPFNAARVQQAERLLQAFLKERLHVEHRYLEEHRHLGLPSRRHVEAQLRGLGGEVASIGHGNLDRWLVLMCLSMYMDHHPVLRGIAQRFHAFYNKSLYETDHAKPVYRHVVIAAYDGAPLPSAEDVLGPQRAPAETVAGFRKMAEELIAFDREKEVFEKEWARLRGQSEALAADLEGHKRSLAELRALRKQQEDVIATLEHDLAGHRESLDSARSELAQVRGDAEESARQQEEVRRELSSDLEQHRAALTALGVDLEGHRESLAELSTELEATRQELGESLSELDRHRELKQELEHELERHRDTVSALGADLEGHRGVVEDLRQELEEVRAGREADQADFEVVRAELVSRLEEADAVIAEHERSLADYQGVVRDQRAELERLQETYRRLRAEHEAVRTALEEDLATHRQVLRALEAELAAQRRAREQERETFEALLAEHRAVIAELEGRLSQHEDVKREHERLLGEQHVVIGEMSEELRDRWRNLRRAVRWKIPDYP